MQFFVSQCHCETSCWRIAQCNMGCLAIFLLREALHEVELSSTFRNGLQQLTKPLHSVSPLQQLVSQFYGSFNKGACAHFLFFVPQFKFTNKSSCVARTNTNQLTCVTLLSLLCHCIGIHVQVPGRAVTHTRFVGTGLDKFTSFSVKG